MFAPEHVGRFSRAVANVERAGTSCHHMPRSIRRNQRPGPRRRRSIGAATSMLIIALAFTAPAGLADDNDKGPKPPDGNQGPPPVTTPPVTTPPVSTPPSTTTPPATTTPPQTTPPTATGTQPPGVSSQAPARPPPAAVSPPSAAGAQPSRGGPPPRTVRRKPRSSGRRQRADRRPRPGAGARPARKRPRRVAAPAARHRSRAAHGGRSALRSRTTAARRGHAGVAAARNPRAQARTRAAGRPAQREAGVRRLAEADGPRRASRSPGERLLGQLPRRLSDAESRGSTPRATVAVPSEGLSPVAILLMTGGAGLVLLLAGRLVGVVTGHAPAADDFTPPPPIPTPLSTGPRITVGTLDLRRARENRIANGGRRAGAGNEVAGEERSAGDR